MKAASPKLLILTGPVHSGKTSLLLDICAEVRRRGLPVDGYLSPAVWSEGGRSGYDLYILPDGPSLPFLRTGRERGRLRVGPYAVDPEGLERARRTIRTASGPAPLVVDEVGPLELGGEGVWPAVEEVLARRPERLVLVIRDTLLDGFLARIKPGIGIHVLGIGDRPALAVALGL